MWRAWFVGGEVYVSTETAPSELPDDGCLGVIHYTGLETPKRHLHSGEDLYFWWDGPEGLVIGSNSDDPDVTRQRYPGCVIVRGKWTTPERMAAVQRQMNEAREAPV